ncbi:RHS repeat-associated core domain-containing protein [Pseudomonas soli]|uniref:RHS repeat-associated core domain-containing protein n=1 Tax=Pseudomonas soli TaxID=1306993 RepID=UPI00381A7377
METIYLSPCDHQHSILRDNDSTRSYAPYGTLRSIDNQRLAFCGQCHEPRTGGYLLGNGHRHYSTSLLRFTSPDTLSPFGAGGINPYAYCNGDPINYIDRNGKSKGKPVVRSSGVNGQGVYQQTETPTVYSGSFQISAMNIPLIAFEMGLLTYDMTMAKRMRQSGNATTHEIGSHKIAAVITAFNFVWELGKGLTGTTLYDPSRFDRHQMQTDLPLWLVDVGLKASGLLINFYAARQRVKYNKRTQAENELQKLTRKVREENIETPTSEEPGD